MIEGYRWRAVTAAALMLLASAVACSKSYGPDERSTADRSRTAAQTMPMDWPVTDAVNRTGGDATDWKVFNVPVAGTYTIEAYWDEPYFEGGIALVDAYGTNIDSERFGGDVTRPAIITFEAEQPNDYYVRIYSDGHYSVYSVRVYPGPPRQAGQEVVDPQPTFDRPIE